MAKKKASTDIATVDKDGYVVSPSASLARVERSEKRRSLVLHDRGGSLGITYALLWAGTLGPALITLAIMGIFPTVLGGILIALSVTAMLTTGGIVATDIHYDPRKAYKRAIDDAINTATDGYHGSKNLVIEPKMGRSFSPTNFLYARTLAKSHQYDVKKGVHEVITVKGSAFGTKVTKESYISDRAIFDRALDRLERL